MTYNKTMTGKFKPLNPKKYMGNPSNIVYRSSWELKVMQYLDKHPDVLGWASEEISIPYLSPVDNRMHRYFPDFLIKKVNEVLLIEVKPKAHTQEPKRGKSGKVTKRYIEEVVTYGINQAKWTAAEKVCRTRGWKFMVMTEDQIFGN